MTSYHPISIAQIRTLAPCCAAYTASSSVNIDLPRPDSPNTVYIFPETYSPIAEYFDFHTLNDSPSFLRSYSSKNLSLPDFMSVPISLRTLVPILTDSTIRGNHSPTNSCPSSSLSFRSNSPVSNRFMIRFFAENDLTRSASHVKLSETSGIYSNPITSSATAA